ncbi:hypothetical protein L1987_32445 [Smallanthus sonchifolius]|uniref:Uncharacterized protein n=1 Tax=Smallanthus sonchifolius TaxID=185202 RepID=A0ACB9HPG5_9ASTR|nr:hypothetical protein L1987_32445 [Smallanthus sonchifolius]
MHNDCTIIVDVKSFEFGTHTGLCAPPREMITEASLGKMKALLYDYGAIIVHVIPADYIFYVDLVENMKSEEEEEDSLKEKLQSLRLSWTLEELLETFLRYDPCDPVDDHQGSKTDFYQTGIRPSNSTTT